MVSCAELLIIRLPQIAVKCEIVDKRLAAINVYSEEIFLCYTSTAYVYLIYATNLPIFLLLLHWNFVNYCIIILVPVKQPRRVSGTVGRCWTRTKHRTMRIFLGNIVKTLSLHDQLRESSRIRHIFWTCAVICLTAVSPRPSSDISGNMLGLVFTKMWNLPVIVLQLLRIIHPVIWHRKCICIIIMSHLASHLEIDHCKK